MIPFTPLTSTVLEEIFFFLSVVMIATATSSKLPGFNDSLADLQAERIFSTGRGTPMTPVEDGRISSVRIPRLSAKTSQVFLALSIPFCPVATLEFLELITIACNFPF